MSKKYFLIKGKTVAFPPSTRSRRFPGDKFDGWIREQKVDILKGFFNLFAKLDLRIVNVCINKRNISVEDYDILEKALIYSIQRLENDLAINQLSEGYMLILDEGNKAKVKKIARKLQRYNYIPSKINRGETYRQEISRLIEDPLFKSSQESVFIQLSDLISVIVYLFCLKEFNSSNWGKKLETVFEGTDITDFLEVIHNKLNLNASSTNKYGIVHFPKNEKRLG